MHRQDLRPSTNSSFSGIVNWQEHIKIYAYCWRKYNWEGSLEHLTCFCPKTNVFWAKITEVMTKNYIQAWESCFPSSRVAMGIGNLCERIKGRSDILCSKGAHGGDVRSNGSRWALDLRPRCSTKIPRFPKSSGSAASPGAVHGTLLHISPK